MGIPLQIRESYSAANSATGGRNNSTTRGIYNTLSDRIFFHARRGAFLLIQISPGVIGSALMFWSTLFCDQVTDAIEAVPECCRDSQPFCPFTNSSAVFLEGPQVSKRRSARKTAAAFVRIRSTTLRAYLSKREANLFFPPAGQQILRFK